VKAVKRLPIFIVLLSAGLSGCAHDQQLAAQKAWRAELHAQTAAATDDCKKRFPVDEPKTIMAKMQCFNQAFAIELPVTGSNADLA
jgi:hypothetical protein